MRIGLLVASVLVLTGCSQAAGEISADDRETPQPTQSQVEEQQLETAESEPEDSVEPESEQQEQSSSEPEETESEEPEESEVDPEPSPESSETEGTESENTEPAEEPSPTPTQEQASGITMADVAARDSAAECWVAIDGNVYDLTAWARSHPGGRGAILNLCGTDGTTQFLSQHGGQATPSATLDDYYLGPLR